MIALVVLSIGLVAAGCGDGGSRDGSPTFIDTTSSDTWAWDAKDWTQLADVGPSWREFAASVYDGANKEWLLFGGAGTDETRLNDTWTRDGPRWTEHFPHRSPSPRAGAAIVYDAAHRQVVLFGGQGWNPTQGRTNYNDTWVWNGVSWDQLIPGLAPPADLFNAPYHLTASGSGHLAYDPISRRVILYGDDHESDAANCPLSPRCPQTWSWDGSNWNQEHPVHALWSGSLFEDLGSGTLKAWGVDDRRRDGLPHEWLWSGGDWAENERIVASRAPEEQAHFGFTYAAAVYGASFGRIFAFGGSYGGSGYCGGGRRTYEDGTWRFDGTSWQLLTTDHRPSPRSDTYLMFDPDRNRIVLWGGIQTTACIFNVL